MKRLTLEATDENILESIKNNTLHRNEDVKEFVETLDSIEGNMFISLDAAWGDGKTFFVRQVEKTLEYVTKRDWGEENEDFKKLKSFFQNTCLRSVVLNKSYFPVYYNAWLYDNHDDPLLSLVLTIVKTTEVYLNTTPDKTVKEHVSELIEGFSVSIGNMQLNPFSKSTEKDILSSVKTAEQIREMVKDILNCVITEKAQRMVIFLDELDRCRPSFAIEMLERIKHYFEDERIIFVVSVNKEQLIHTISKCYGYGFDSSGYLNKFFDLNAHMPISLRGSSLFDVYYPEQKYFTRISEGLNIYYKLSLRDSLVYKQRLQNIDLTYIYDYDTQGCCLSLYVPIIVVLDIIDQNEKRNFLAGESELLENLINDIPAIGDMVSAFGNARATREQAILEGIPKIMATYRYVFKELRDTPQQCLPVSSRLKKMCIQICNSVKKD